MILSVNVDFITNDFNVPLTWRNVFCEWVSGTNNLFTSHLFYDGVHIENFQNKSNDNYGIAQCCTRYCFTLSLSSSSNIAKNFVEILIALSSFFIVTTSKGKIEYLVIWHEKHPWCSEKLKKAQTLEQAFDPSCMHNHIPNLHKETLSIPISVIYQWEK